MYLRCDRVNGYLVIEKFDPIIHDSIKWREIEKCK
jgi:hypothetical protein